MAEIKLKTSGTVTSAAAAAGDDAAGGGSGAGAGGGGGGGGRGRDRDRDRDRALDYRSRLGIAGDRSRERRTRRERFVEGLKTFLWVAPLTALIWIWAEREQVAVQTGVRVKIEVKPDSPDRLVTLTSPANGEVEVDLSGPRASLDLVRDRLADLIRREGRLVVPISEEAGYRGEVFNLAERLARANDLFGRNAVTVEKARTPVTVEVERKVRVRVPVRARPADKAKIHGTVSFEPEAAVIEGPASVLAGKTPEELALEVDLSTFTQKPPGKYEERVALPLPGGLSVVEPRTVMAKVDVVAASTTLRLSSIPTSLVVPTSLLRDERYTIDGPLTITNVEVTGPPEVLQQMSAGTLSGHVQLVLPGDQWRTPGEKQVKILAEHYRMPKDVTVLNPEKTVTVTLTPRTP